MKKLLFILLLCGCATTRPSEVALELPQPEPRQYKQLPPIPQPVGFMTDKYLQEEQIRVRGVINEFISSSNNLEYHIRLEISEALEGMEAIATSIQPGISLSTLLERERLLVDYMEFINSIRGYEIKSYEKLAILKRRSDSIIPKP